MLRNLDIAVLRSFVGIVDFGSATRAAQRLNLTQGAVSMQLKRLEETFQRSLFERNGRTLLLTAEGEQLASYARKILSLNDEAWERLTAKEYDGKVRLGVPPDIVNPQIPQVLRSFKESYPRIDVPISIAGSAILVKAVQAGELDLTILTEVTPPEFGEVLAQVPLLWAGKKGTTLWQRTPIPLAFSYACRFRLPVEEALDAAGIPWKNVLGSGLSQEITAEAIINVAADLAIHACVETGLQEGMGFIDHRGALPALPDVYITALQTTNGESGVLEALKEHLRKAYNGV